MGKFETPSGADICFLGTGRGTDLSGAEQLFLLSKLSCFDIDGEHVVAVDDDELLRVGLEVKGIGAGRNG